MFDRNNLPEFAQQNQSPDLAGCFRARVVDDVDPDGLGRVKVRVFSIHGPDDVTTPTEVLPWAEVPSSGGGGYDFGSDNTPPVGAWVWVMFENGHHRFPVVMGGARGTPRVQQEYGTISGSYPDGTAASDRSFTPPVDQTELPKDSYALNTDTPKAKTRHVWQKSYKGHTILVEDKDGEEWLRIIDRAGQMVELKCNSTISANEGNLSQRGIRTAERADQLDKSAMVAGGTHIRLVDLAGQEIILDPSTGNERITLRNKNYSGSKVQEIDLNLNSGKAYLRMRGANGEEITLKDGDEIPIVIKDHAGNSIEFAASVTPDGKPAGIRINSIGDHVNNHNQVRDNISGDHTRGIGGNEDITVTGNRTTQVGNDMAEAILGNVTRTVGGAIVETVTNTPLNAGAATPYARDTLLAGPIAAGDRIQIAGIGDIERRILVQGDVIFDTLLGELRMNATSPTSTLVITIGTPPTSITIDAGGNLTVDNGTNGPNIQITKTGLAAFKGSIGTLLGPAPSLAMVDPVKLLTALTLWAATFIVPPGAPGSSRPLAYAPPITFFTQALIGSTNCFLTP